MTEYNVIRKLFYIVIGCCICIPIYPYNRRNVRIWSNKPAYTQVMENENERGLLLIFMMAYGKEILFLYYREFYINLL